MSLLSQLAGDYDSERQPGRFTMPISKRAALDMNDAGNAKRLLAAYGDDMIYVHGRGWGIWDGNRFSFSSGGLRADALAARLPDLVAEEIEAIWEEEVDEFTATRRLEAELKKRPPQFTDLESAAHAIKVEATRKLSAHRIKCGNVDKQVKALRAAQHQVAAEIIDLDADPWKLVVRNGVVDLRRVADAEDLDEDTPTASEIEAWRSSWLRDPDRAPRPTKCAGTPFVPGASCPEWEDFIELILPDQAIRDCAQRAFGAMLFGRNVAQIALLLRGSGGNGKSTLMYVLSEVMCALDGYAAPCKVEMFLVTQNQSAGQATPEEVDLPGARVMLASEPAATDIFSAKKIKSLTGGDYRPARGLGKDQFIYRPTGVPVIMFNRTPRIKDEDEGTRRRLVFLPLDVNLRLLPPHQRRAQHEVEGALKAEMPGILNWMLDGFREFMRRLEVGQGTPPGIDPPPAMMTLKDEIMDNADPIGAFIKDCAILDPEGHVLTREFFSGIKAWARDVGATLYRDGAIRKILEEKGFSKGKSNGRMVFRGLRWNGEELTRDYIETPEQRGGYDLDR